MEEGYNNFSIPVLYGGVNIVFYNFLWLCDALETELSYESTDYYFSYLCGK